MKMLDNEAMYLGQLGEDVTDVSQLWNFAVMQADGLSPVPALATATDLDVVVPGSVSLDFSRVYEDPIDRARYGRARWATAGATTGSIRCRSASDGTVTVTMPSGEQRVFQPDSRPGGGYFDQPGDYGILTAGGGGTFHAPGDRRPDRGLQRRRHAQLHPGHRRQPDHRGLHRRPAHQPHRYVGRIADAHLQRRRPDRVGQLLRSARRSSIPTTPAST